MLSNLCYSFLVKSFLYILLRRLIGDGVPIGADIPVWGQGRGARDFCVTGIKTFHQNPTGIAPLPYLLCTASAAPHGKSELCYSGGAMVDGASATIFAWAHEVGRFRFGAETTPLCLYRHEFVFPISGHTLEPMVTKE